LNLPYRQSIQKTADALKVEGFGVLTQIDVEATLKREINNQNSHILAKLGVASRTGAAALAVRCQLVT